MQSRAIPLDQQQTDFTSEGSPPPGMVKGATPALADEATRAPAPPPQPTRRRPTLHLPRSTAH